MTKETEFGLIKQVDTHGNYQITNLGQQDLIVSGVINVKPNETVTVTPDGSKVPKDTPVDQMTKQELVDHFIGLSKETVVKPFFDKELILLTPNGIRTLNQDYEIVPHSKISPLIEELRIKTIEDLHIRNKMIITHANGRTETTEDFIARHSFDQTAAPHWTVSPFDAASKADVSPEFLNASAATEHSTTSVSDFFNQWLGFVRQSGKSLTAARMLGKGVYTRTGSFKRFNGKMRNRKRMFAKSLELNRLVILVRPDLDKYPPIVFNKN
jgi:hypothetical protein